MSAASARSLFRATGKRGSVELPREKDDFYPTPPGPTQALIEAERARLGDFSAIWEPAAGDGAMVREMQAAGFSVVASDLIDRGCGAQIASFYDFSTRMAPAIITNPPFKECASDKGWVRFALEVIDVDYMALLLPLNWMGAGVARAKLWRDHPPARVYVMRWRIDFTGQGAPPMLCAWFVWDCKHSGPTQLLPLDRPRTKDGGLFGEVAA